MHGNDYGTDPRGFIGWANETKAPFLYAMMMEGGISLFLSFIFLVNLSFTQTRKSNIVEALAAKGQGLAICTFIFTLTWMFAYYAYWHVPDLERADSYPIFQLINSWIGVFIFCFMGLGTKKFRNIFRCKEEQRSNKLKYLIGDLRTRDAEDIENRRDSFDDLSSTSSNDDKPDSLDEEDSESSDEETQDSGEEDSSNASSDSDSNEEDKSDEEEEEDGDESDDEDDEEEEEHDDNDNSDESDE